MLCNKAPFPPNDGSSIATYNMAKGLERVGINIQVLAINTKKHYKSDDEVRVGFEKKSSYESVYLNTNPTFFGAFLNLFSRKSYIVSRFIDSEFEYKLIETLKHNQFEIIQLEGLFVAPYLEKIRQWSNAKIVLRAHNIEYLIWERHLEKMNNGLKKFYLNIQKNRLKKFEHLIFKSVDAIVPITESDASEALNYTDCPIHTAFAGVNPENYAVEKSTKFDPYSIFHFGSMDWIPNQEAVVWFVFNCWPKIMNEFPKATLILAGRNMPKKIKALASDKIIIKENVRDSSTIYSQYNVMIVPVLSGSGMRIKIVEGLCYGKAIVSTSLGAEGIQVTPGQHMLQSDTSESFASAVIELLKNNEKRSQLEKNAHDFALAQLNYIPIADKLVAFYKKLIHL